MEKRNFNGVQISQSVTIVEKAGEEIADGRNRIMVYDDNGAVVLAKDASKPAVGISLIESGFNDVSGRDAGFVAAGEDVDIQIKDIGCVLAGAEIAKGAEVAAGEKGLAKPAEAGEYVAGIALSAAGKDEYVRIQIMKYQKNSDDNVSKD